MSATTVYLAYPDRVEKIATLSNSWGSGAFVWSAMGLRYLNDRHAWLCDPNGAQKVWDLVNDPRLKIFERIVLAATFDHAITETSKFYDAAEHWANFEKHYREADRECHAGTISQLLLHHFREQTPCIGMCFRISSVAENPWDLWDEEEDEPIPFSLKTYPHFFVFEQYGVV